MARTVTEEEEYQGSVWTLTLGVIIRVVACDLLALGKESEVEAAHGRWGSLVYNGSAEDTP